MSNKENNRKWLGYGHQPFVIFLHASLFNKSQTSSVVSTSAYFLLSLWTSGKKNPHSGYFALSKVQTWALLISFITWYESLCSLYRFVSNSTNDSSEIWQSQKSIRNIVVLTIFFLPWLNHTVFWMTISVILSYEKRYRNVKHFQKSLSRRGAFHSSKRLSIL